LEELIQNELEFRTFTNQLDIMQQYNEIQQRQLNKNVSIAKSNLQYEDEIQQLHGNITKLHAELQAKVKAFQQLEQQQDKILQPPPVSKIVRELTKAKKEAYVQSEQIAEQWLLQQQSSSSFTSEENGNGNSIPTFIEAFKAVRKVQHVRAAKLELVQQRQSQIPPNGTNHSLYTL
jgi:predicted  nucleic acid-binding Zn-ribbon protein